MNLKPVDSSDIEEVKVLSTVELVMFSEENTVPVPVVFSLATTDVLGVSVEFIAKFIDKKSLRHLETFVKDSTEAKCTLNRELVAELRKFTKFDIMYEVHETELLFRLVEMLGEVKKLIKVMKVFET